MSKRERERGRVEEGERMTEMERERGKEGGRRGWRSWE